MRRRGLTLIEVIISITIFTIIVSAAYSVFYMGIKMWRRTQEEKSIQKVRLALLKMEKELKDTFFFSERPFTGTHREMFFPIVASESDSKELYIVTYTVNEDRDAKMYEILRKQELYSGDGEEEKDKRLISSMKSVGFEYAYKSNGLSKNIKWQSSWDGKSEGKIPAAVRISLEPQSSDEIYNKVVFVKQDDLNLR